MKDFCPICNDVTSLEEVQIKEKHFIKKEEFIIHATLLKCEKCGESFENGQLEVSNYLLAADVYRKAHELLTTEEIVGIREKYGLSQRLLCRLFDWSPSLLCQYENGKIQDSAHNDLLEMIKSPWSMCKYYLRHKNRLNEKEAKSLFATIKPLLEVEEHEEQISTLISSYEGFKQEFTGRKYFNLDKTVSLVQYIASKVDGLYKTKLFKILFYVDFYYYKKNRESVTGIPYCKLPFGPVPDDYQKFLRVLSFSNKIAVESQFDGELEKVRISNLVKPNLQCFNKNEIHIIKQVTDRLRGIAADKISYISHDEDGYILTNDWEPIDYKYADSLKLSFD